MDIPAWYAADRLAHRKQRETETAAEILKQAKAAGEGRQ